MRPFVRPIPLVFVLAPCLLMGCEGEAPALADAGPDAGIDLCLRAQIEPLLACTPPSPPVVACTLTVEVGGRLRAAATFDAAGRLTSSTDGEFGEVQAFDVGDRRHLWERVREGCLIGRTISWMEGDRVVRRDDAPERMPTCTDETFVGDVFVQRTADDGCACGEGRLEERCEIEDGRPVRCETWARDGSSSGVETRAWTDAGLLARVGSDWEGDGLEDHVEVFEYDATGRMTLNLETRRVCEEGPCAVRRTWLYEDDLRRTTRSIDEEDDGRVERIDRTTLDAVGRRVLDERSGDGGVSWTVTAWTREVEGDRVTVTRTVDDVVEAVAVERTDAAGRLVSRSDTLPGRGLVSTLALTYDAAGRIMTEQRTEAGGCFEDYACTAVYRWEGADCPALRMRTDADAAPSEQVFPVGVHCIPQGEGC